MPALTDEEKRTLALLFLRAAKEEGIVFYPQVYSAVNRDGDRDNTLFRGLEDALKLLSPDRSVLYDALLTKKNPRLPSSGFFDALENNPAYHWRSKFPDRGHQSLTEEEKFKVVGEYRKIVYRHAKSLNPEDI